MSGKRLFTGIGIAVGGTGGALAALLGAPTQPVEAVQAPSALEKPKDAVVEVASAGESVPRPAPPLSSATAATSPSASAAAAASPSSTPAALASASASAPWYAPALGDIPTTREALLKAQLFCDQKKDFDECARAAQAFETGSAGPAEPEQAKRFRKIAMTHLVTQCEAGNSPHACFVLAAKYRTGTDFTLNPTGAEALERRALELCRFRQAPECPAK